MKLRKKMAGPHPAYGESMQTLQVRLTKKMLDDIDSRLSLGYYESRSALVRDAVRRFFNEPVTEVKKLYGADKKGR